MAKLVMAINMANMGVFLKRRKNADHTRKPFVNWSNAVKVMAKTKKFLRFYGSSPTVIEWDKIVTEIIITTIFFFRHPTPSSVSPRKTLTAARSRHNHQDLSTLALTRHTAR